MTKTVHRNQLAEYNPENEFYPTLNEEYLPPHNRQDNFCD